MKRLASFLYNKRLLRSTIVMSIMVALSANVFTCMAAHAAGGTANFSLQPAVYDPTNPVTRSYFVLNLNPGATKALTFRVTNTGTAAGVVHLYAVDATTGQNSGVVFRAHNEPRKDVGSWITLNTSQLTLAAGQSQTLSFTVAVPTNARPEQHVGGIIAEGGDAQQSNTKNGHFQINIYHQFAMAVQVNLPGPAIEQLVASGVQSGGANGYQTLLTKLSNTGTVMVKGNGSLRVIDTHGTLLQNLPISLDTFLPDTSINYPVTVQKKALTAGDYQVSLHLNYGHGKTLDYTTKLTITQDQVAQAFANGPLQAPTSSTMMPLWQMILVGLAALIILLMGGKKVYDLIAARRRKQTKNPTPPVDGSHQPMDTSKSRDKVA